jgi:hypothetical protein
MPIPAGDRQVVHQYRGDPRVIFNFLAPGVDFTAGFDIHSVLPHQHLLGTRIRAWVRQAGGKKVPLVDVPSYDFHWQREYWLAEAERFGANDRLELECQWGEPRDVNWGEATTDEMCAVFIYVTPVSK